MIAKQKRTTVPTRAALAAKLGRHERTIGEYLSRGMPGKPGAYPVQECREWVSANIEARGGDEEDEPPPGDIRRMLLEEQHRKLKLQNDQLEEQLVQREEVEQVTAELILRVKQRLEAVPDELEVELPAENRAYLKQRLSDKVRLILTEMSRWEIGVDGST